MSKRTSTLQKSRSKSGINFRNNPSLINQELIDTLKFQFAAKPLFGGTPSGLPGDIEEKVAKTFGSAETLLEMAVENSEARHFHHLRYLAGKHAAEAEKIRFMLQPFSFIFLLRGDASFHIVLETYDTEEATYLWRLDHFPNPYPIHEANPRIWLFREDPPAYDRVEN